MKVNASSGIFLAVGCMMLYALLNIYGKLTSNMGINPFLLTALASIFSGALLLLRGGYSNLAKRAMASKYTWIYGISEFLEVCFVMSLYFFVSASEGALVTRIAVILSVVAAHVFLRRTALKAEYIGLIPVAIGLIMVYMQMPTDLMVVLSLSLAVAVFRNLYYFSIELNPVPYETKSITQDYSVIGYIVSVTGICVFGLLLINALVGHAIGATIIKGFPNLHEFANLDMFIMSAIFGCTILFGTKYLEFKAIQSVKTETFQFVVAFSPIATLLMELGLSHSDYYQTNLTLDPTFVFANILIVSGSVYVVLKKYSNPVLEDRSEIQDVRELVISATLFFKDDYQKAADALGISLSVLHDIMDEEREGLIIKREVAAMIEKNHHRRISMSDALTGLANKLQFITQLKSLNTGGTLSLLYLDLNKFKPVNDKYGHAAGDMVLAETAKRLQQLAGRSGIVTRLGGDEFAILMNGMTKTDASALITEVKEAVAAPIFLAEQGVEVVIGTSVGVANYPEDISNPEHIEGLISLADKNMFRDKEDSGDGR